MVNACTGPSAQYATVHKIQDVQKHKRRQVDDDYSEWVVNTFSDSNPWWKATADALTRSGKMKRQQPAKNNVHDLLCDLKSCSRKRDLQEGRRVHIKAAESGNDSNIFVAAALINMYAKCGSMVDARQVFDSIEKPDVVSWTALIMGYTDNGQGQVALNFFSRMKSGGCAPDSVTYVAAIKACTSLAANEAEKRGSLKRGREIHLEIGHHMDHVVLNTLINMYVKFGSMIDARRVFDSIQKPDVMSRTTLILGYADNGEGKVALNIFSRMKASARDSVAYVAAIKGCTSLAVDEAGKKECLERGREIHSCIGHHMNHLVKNTLINMYAKCGSMTDAQRAFNSIEDPDVVSWTALIQGYADNGEGEAALDFFSKMKATPGCVPDSVTYIAAMKACTSLATDEALKAEILKRGREIHLEMGHHIDHVVQNTLINMYVKFGSMVEARKVFDSIDYPDVVSWNALILGYADNSEAEAALDSFSHMKAVRGCDPDSVTYVAVIKACTCLGVDEARKRENLQRGREIHLEIGCHVDPAVQNTLINMYAKFGSMVEAKKEFDSVQELDVVSWNVLIMGYTDNGEGQTALDIFSRMKSAQNCTPDSVTYVAVLKACGSVGSLAIGRNVHSNITDFDVHVVTCLVDFYAKCGSMVEAREVFDSHLNRDITTWNALLAGYGRFGDSDGVFTLFKAMQDHGFCLDASTFVCILLSCSHAGLVEKAGEYLKAMPVQYGVTPTVMHYTCMVDVLGRANKLEEAVALIQKMPCKPDSVTWMAVLGACRKWKNVEIGRLAFQSLGKKNATAYILMAEIYGCRGMLKQQERLLKSRRGSAGWKLPGQAYVMDGLGRMVKFVVGEEDPPEVKHKLEQLFKGMKEHGYNISRNVVEIEKEELCGHSERRAIVYGILNTPPDEPIRAFKNTRMCYECHWVIKLFSKLSSRVIIVRDESQFHVMENGSCSCGEYW